MHLACRVASSTTYRGTCSHQSRVPLQDSARGLSIGSVLSTRCPRKLGSNLGMPARLRRPSHNDQVRTNNKRSWPVSTSGRGIVAARASVRNPPVLQTTGPLVTVGEEQGLLIDVAAVDGAGTNRDALLAGSGLDLARHGMGPSQPHGRHWRGAWSGRDATSVCRRLRSRLASSCSWPGLLVVVSWFDQGC